MAKKKAIAPETETKDGLKVMEEKKQLGKTAFNFYPNEYGGEKEAYDECKMKSAGSKVYWDEKLACFYYYLPD